MATAKSNGTGIRVIVHLDLDCFYAQVEQKRLGIPCEEPLAVQQWGSLLAINYVARKFGVSRGDNVTDAKKKCPSIHVPHVELLGENHKPGSAYDRTHQKAILRRYRVASKAIYEILYRFASICERAGVDEAYLDITEQVRQRIDQLDVVSSDFCADRTNEDTKVVGITPLEGTGKELELEPFDAFPVTDEERWLSVGAVVTREIRKAIFDELGYTCSVGIATTKLIAKMVSPLNKPAGQTILSSRFLAPLMQHFPLRKIRGLGGKLGRDLMGLYYKSKGEDVNVLATNSWGLVADPNAVGVKPTLTVAAFVEAVSMEDMVAHLGHETATYVRGFCYGDDGNDPVNATKTEIKTFSAAKQYDEKSRLMDVNQLKYWLPILAEEVCERCEEEKSENKRFPSQVTINYTRVGAKTKSRAFPVSLDFTIESITKAALAALQHDIDTMFPCAGLSIYIKDFMPMGSRSASISTFFSKAEPGSQLEPISAPAPMSATTITPPSFIGTKRKISSFFSSSSVDATPVSTDQSNENAASDTGDAGPYFCDKCDKFVYEPRAEHADYHFALQLSRGSSQQGSTQAAFSKITQKAKKPRQGPLDAFLGR